MEKNDFIECNDINNYLLLSQNGFTLIRNIGYCRNNEKMNIDLQTALEKLRAIGKLAQALHNIPIEISDKTYFQRKAIIKSLHNFLMDYPQYYSFLCENFILPEQIIDDIQKSYSIVDDWQRILFPA